METTNFADVYEYAVAEIDDVRLENLKKTNPALYLRRLWDYLRNAIPLFSSPMGMVKKLENYVAPTFDDETFVCDGQTTVFTLSTGGECICVTNDRGNVVAVIIPAESTTDRGVTYDEETHTLTFATAPHGEIYVDLYTDGYFNFDLNIKELSILGIAFRLVWFSKIANTFLRTTPKIKDKNFNMDSSWGVEQADTAKVKSLKTELVDAMKEYENSLAYGVVVPSARQLLNRAT